MSRVEKPAEGSWTEHYPELGTAPMSYEDSISPEFYELEREAIFKRAWLNVGRVEQLPRKGSYFTKELAVANTSVVVVRGMDGEVRAFHNICRHRGNKLVWTDFPREEIERELPPVRLQVPRLEVRARRRLLVRAAGERVLRPRQGRLRPRARALRRVVGIRVRQPRREPTQSLVEFLGPMITAIDGYPFDAMTERFSYRAVVGSNWKLFMDAFQEFYHAPVLHAKQSPVSARPEVQAAGFEGLHYEIDGPHRMVTTYGGRGGRCRPTC